MFAGEALPLILSMSVELLPDDAFNRELIQAVHPPDWVNPVPDGRYNLVVIGGGTAGLVTAAGASGLGARVALVERHLLGGDCLNYGCVPSKAILRSGRAAAEVRTAARLGVHVPGGFTIDFPQVMSRMREIRSRISHNDSAERFRKLGVDVYLGDGRFIDGDTIGVGDARLNFRKAVIATGARAVAPNVPGLKEVGFLTNETIFSLERLPRRLAVLGGGPIGCELAQAFARFGSIVTLIEQGPQILGREDQDAAGVVLEALVRDGVEVHLCATLGRVQNTPGGKALHYTHREAVGSTEVDAILVAAGRAPNVQGMGLEKVGVVFNERTGITTDDFLRTHHPRIFAVGDVASNYKFTHAADALARIAIQNALFRGRKRASRLLIPWCTYTEPELAQIGLTERTAGDRDIEVDVYIRRFSEVDRAITEGETEGFVKILTAHKTDRIVGATVVGVDAGNLIGEIAVAMSVGCGLGKLGSVIHPYPTRASAIQQCGDAWSRTRLTPGIKNLSERWLRWTR